MALNTEQKLASEKFDGPLLILAGAGTGKTTTLMKRIENMVSSGIRPENILAVTFTNKAAKEMRDRIALNVSEETASALTMGTFHSVCFRIVFDQWKVIRPESQNFTFKLLDPPNVNTIVKGFINEFDEKSRVRGASIAKHISLFKNEMITSRHFKALAKRTPISELKELDADIDWKKAKEMIYDIPPEHLQSLEKVYPAYEDYLRATDQLDLDDLLLETALLFKNNPATLAYYQEIYKYIMVDEYQDSNKVQYNIVKSLGSKYRNVGVVGDDYQSIYKFRGADIRNILDFQKDYPDATVIKLVQNYRSQDYIVDAANSVIINNKHQLHKTLVSNIPKDKKIQIVSCQNARQTAEDIRINIEEGVKSGKYNYDDYVVLYRSNSMAADIEIEFMSKSDKKAPIPFVKLSGLGFFELEEIQDIIQYLNLINNPRNIESFSRSIMRPLRRIANRTIAKITRKHFKNNLLDILDDLSQIDRVQSRAVEEGKKFANLIRKYQAMAETHSVTEIIEDLLEEIDYVNLVLRENYDKDVVEKKSNNIEKLLEMIATEETETGKPILLSEYMNTLTMFNQKETDTSNRVKLMTLHGCKGLEFPVVHIIGMNAGQFPPTFRGNGDYEEFLEEERRLFYVGMTRAKVELYLHQQSSYTTKDKTVKPLNGSQFLDELDPSIVSHIY